jgi:hypothetical protein
VVGRMPKKTAARPAYHFRGRVGSVVCTRRS